MSSHVVVISTDFRRATVKVSPGTYLVDVLQEACKKLNISSDKYSLKYKQKQVDLSLPFRASGLVAGAKLELVQKSNTPSAVQIALQLPQPEAKEIPGGRLIKKFPSDLTLWQILRQFESGDASAGRNINITARGIAQTTDGGSGAGQLYYEAPVLNIMGRDFGTFIDFQKTMSQLGHNSGNVLVRLTFKKTSQTLYDAMQEIGQHFKEEEQASARETVATTSAKQVDPTPAAHREDTTMEDAPLQPATETIASATTQVPGSDQPTTEQEDIPEADGKSADPLQPVNIYLAPSGAVPIAAQASAEENDFTPTIAHAKLHQARLQESSRNKRLLSDKELEEKAATEEARLASIKNVLVKIRFPDNTSSDWQVDNTQTGAFLYEAVRHVMADNSLPFHLVLPGGKTTIADDDSQKHNLVRAYKLAGRVLVSLVWDDKVPAAVRKQPFLKSSVVQQGKKIKVQDIPEEAPEPKGKTVASFPEEKRDEPKRGEGGAKKMPKWLKLGKK